MHHLPVLVGSFAEAYAWVDQDPLARDSGIDGVPRGLTQHALDLLHQVARILGSFLVVHENKGAAAAGSEVGDRRRALQAPDIVEDGGTSLDRRLGNLDLVSVDRNGHPSLSRQMLDHSLGTADLLGNRDGFMARARRLAADVENVRAFADHHHGLGDGGLSVVEPVAAERVGTHVDDAHHIGPPAPLEPMPGDVGSLHGPIMLPPYQ